MYKILFIDDEKSVIQYLPKAVDWQDLCITEMRDASNGREGLDVMEEFDPDIVIVDMEMPVMNGITFCQEVRKKNTKVKIIILSAFDKFDYVKNALKYDVNNYLLKPIDEEELEQSVREVIAEIQKEKSEDTELEQLKIQGLLKELQEIYECFKETKTYEISLDEKYPFLKDYPAVCVVRYAGRTKELEYYTVLKKCLAEKREYECYPVYVNSVFTVIFGKARGTDDFRKYLEQLDQELIDQGISLVYAYNNHTDQSVWEKVCGGMQAAASWFYHNEERMICSHYSKENRQELPSVDIRAGMEELESTSEAEKLKTLILETVCEAVKLGTAPEVIFNFVLDTFIAVKIYLAQSQKEEFMDVFRKVNFETFMVCRNPKELDELIRKNLKILEEKSQAFYQENEGMYIVRQAKKYTRENYSDSNLTLQEVADYAGISKNYFSKMFKEMSGEKYWDYLTEYRIERAKELLRETNLSQSMICEKIGYQSEYHFSRKFKELTGISPNKYRNK